MALLHSDRLSPSGATRGVARRLYESVRALTILSPHGHTRASWSAPDQPFADPAKLFIQPDHSVPRMLYSQGVPLEDLEVGADTIRNPRKVWCIFAQHYYLFRGTPTRVWLDFAFQELFGLESPLNSNTAVQYFDVICL